MANHKSDDRVNMHTEAQETYDASFRSFIAGVIISVVCSIFFFQAEDGIRDYKVTGVQTCALPIWTRSTASHFSANVGDAVERVPTGPIPPLLANLGISLIECAVLDGLSRALDQIGRASCRERV